MLKYAIFMTTVVTVIILSPFSVGSTWADSPKEVVVYTALDQVFSEPVLKDFEKQTGIKVRAVYDIEATKTTGLVNRLIAEKSNPQCDVFWNNEVLKSIMLKRQGVLEPYRSPAGVSIPAHFKDPEGYWTGFAARARVVVVNTSRLAPDEYPTSIFDLPQDRWEEQTGIANPLFGTTSTHVAALFAYLGEEKAKDFFQKLKANGVQILDGNSVVKDQVGSGALLAGFTDTDDVNTGVLSGLPIKALYPDHDGMGTLLIPNTVGLIKNCPHPENGRILIDYLLSKEVEKALAFCPSVQMPLRPDVETPDDFVSIGEIKTMEVDFEAVADVMDTSVKYVQDLFIR